MSVSYTHLFLARQSVQLKARMCTNIKCTRVAVTPEAIEEYFNELSESLKDIQAEAILNYDASMQDNPGRTKVIFRRTCKHAERIMDFSKTNFSVMFSGSASGLHCHRTLSTRRTTCITPVSYTHLDVYKRQKLTRVLNESSSQ